MPRRLLRLVASRLPQPTRQATPAFVFDTPDLVWAIGSFCALKRQPFSADLLVRQFAPPYSADSLIHAARALGFRIKRQECSAETVGTLNLPCLVVLREEAPADVSEATDDGAESSAATGEPIPLPKKPAPPSSSRSPPIRSSYLPPEPTRPGR